MVRVRTYWWQEISNFGDTLTVPLAKHFAGIDPLSATPEQSNLVLCGSSLDLLPEEGWVGVVAGAGMLYTDSKIDLTKAKVLGVRGPETLKRLKVTPGTDVVLGDPALLASELVSPHRNKYPLGVVPHISDEVLFANEYARAKKHKYSEPILIDPKGDPLDVVRQIGECSKIISSSLHGLVVADAFGIPRRAEKFDAMKSNKWEGKEFKFIDYGNSIGQPIKWSHLQTAPTEKIFSIQSELFDMMKELKKITRV